MTVFVAVSTGCDKDDASPPGAGAMVAAPVATIEPARYLEGHTDGVHGVAFSPDSSLILTAGHDGTARLWEVGTGKQVHRLEGHATGVYGAAFSADGKRVATGGFDGDVMVWDAGSGELLAILDGHAEGTIRVAFLADDTVISAGQDGTLRQWDVTREEAVWAVRAGPRGVHVLAVSEDSDLVATGGADGFLTVWDMRIQRPSWRLKSPMDEEELSALRTRQQTEGAGPKRARADQTVDGPESDGRSSGRSIVQTVAFSTEGSKVYSQMFHGPVHEWDAQTGRHLRQIGLPSVSESIGVSGDGRWLVADIRGGLHLFDLRTEEMKASLPPNDVIRQVAFSPDGKRLTVARGGMWQLGQWKKAQDPRVPVWDVAAITAASGDAAAPAGK